MRKTTWPLLAILLAPTLCQAQNLPSERRSDWHHAGRGNPIPDYATVLNILDFGGSGDSTTLNEIPFQHAVEALQDQPGVIFFPAGKYLFHGPIALRDSLVLRGEGSERSELFFDLGSAVQNCIVARGNLVPDSLAIPLAQSANRGDTLLFAQTNAHAGDLFRLQFDDSLVIFSIWARGSAGQLLEAKTVENDRISLKQPLRFDFDTMLRPRLRRIDPVDDAGLECLKIKRLDANVPIGSNIVFDHARRCWLVGVESEQCNFAHVTFSGSTHCEVYGCYAHDAFAFGGGGQGYGLVFESTSGDNRAQNNIFRRLRHSMLLQSGANGNVLGYNFSTDPFWEEFPNDGAGDIAIHGNYPSHNLFEGNICENIRPDGSHGDNGPFNTFFRNRTTGYGLIVTAAEYQHSYNFMANEIVPGGFLQGLYLIVGDDIFQEGNSQNGNIVPAGSPIHTDTSLYFSARPSFLGGTDFLIGPPAGFNTASIPAQARFFSGGAKTDCEGRAGLSVGTVARPERPLLAHIFPNPAVSECIVRLQTPGVVEVFDVVGACWFSQAVSSEQRLDCRHWPAGWYVVRVRSGSRTNTFSLIKSAQK